MNRIFIIVVLVLIIVLSWGYHRINKLQKDLEVAQINELAYILEANDLQKGSIEYRHTISQLENSQDSLTKAMLNAAKELEIKNKKIQQLQYSKSIVTKVDTFFAKDTIFADRYLNVDTLLFDDWYSLRLQLQYPNKIITTPTFESSLHTVIHVEKEYVGGRKKFFISRWFQKKQDVVRVDLLEQNPYISVKESRVEKIIK